MGGNGSIQHLVALRKESVDRNSWHLAQGTWHFMSLSARRAWIEIQFRGYTSAHKLSLSARRAWIEMVSPLWNQSAYTVALRKESVDRNNNRRFNHV